MPKIIIFFLVLFIKGLSFASDCRAAKWPYSKNIKEIQPIFFQAVKRDHLYNYFYYELATSPSNRVKGLAFKLLYYLKNTEQNEDKYQMLLALEWASDLTTSRPRVIPLSEICAIEDKINRQPSSEKKKFTKKKKL